MIGEDQSGGLFTGVLFALAGRIFAESRPDKTNTARVLEYLLPLVVIAAFQLKSNQWIVPFNLVPIAIFWLSVAAFTKVGDKDAREDIQNRFWWLNHRAITTAVIAAFGFAIISLGMFAIERSLDALFGLDVSDLFYKYIMPIAGTFLIPFYWISTIPRLDDYHIGELDESDFLSRAIGFLGQFVLAPLLAIYALILFAYAVQSIFTRSLPEGTLGWMVLGFTITGAANWLLLHPPFMRTRKLVQLFRNYWFYITIVPIGLYTLAVWIRIDTYGLTPERILLVAGGVWSVLLTVAFLSKRFADIRLIPALAGVAILVVSTGPWNYINGALLNQGYRLQSALRITGWTAADPTPNWSPALAERADGAVRYLYRKDGEDMLEQIFSPLGVARAKWEDTPGELTRMLNLPPPPEGAARRFISFGIPQDASPIDLTATPVYLGTVALIPDRPAKLGDLELRLVGADIQLWEGDVQTATGNLKSWLAKQDHLAGRIDDPLFMLKAPDKTLNFVFQFVSGAEGGEQRVSSLTGLVFTDQRP